ncbi:MAG: hypothetical protein C5B49_05960 [Bdellovibrio sp.]|nr:MAG: hypothetical protein C5B49_05960 [Bdellovibrio sp.]
MAKAPQLNSHDRLLKTLTRRDSEFDSYLLGTFSTQSRAIPVQTLNANSDSELVTFQIVPVEEIHQPPWFIKWPEVFKVRSLILVAFPIFCLLTNNLADEVPMDATLVACSVLSALFIFVGANLLNDYFDYVRGLDRIHPEQKPIQKGWVTAAATRAWAAVYLAVGGLLGLPAVVVQPVLLYLVALPTGVALGAWLTRLRGLRFRRGAEILVFLMAGPLLTVGFQVAVTGQADVESLWIGALTGWFAVFLVHLKNFSSLMVNAQAGFQNTIVLLGFDRSKKMLAIWWLVLLIGFSAYQYVYALPEWFVASLVGPPLISVSFWRKLREVKSPAGSGLQKLDQLGRTVALLLVTWWTIENLCSLLMVELGSGG